MGKADRLNDKERPSSYGECPFFWNLKKEAEEHPNQNAIRGLEGPSVT